MRALFTSGLSGERRPRPLQIRQAPLYHLLSVGVLTLLLAIGTLIVYLTGGTAYAYPYLMLVPVLLAAAWYGILGALAVALAAGVLMATMPLHVATGTEQDTTNWLIRLGLFLTLGGCAGGLFWSLRQTTVARDATLRTDPRSGLPNQIALVEDLANCLAEFQRCGKSVSLVLIRITDITDILEAMGADASDELVTAISERLRREVPVAGIYRSSDAELILLVRRSDQYEIDCIVQRLIDAGEENLTVQGVPMRAQLALGISVPRDTDSRPDDLIREARIAMFAAIEKHRSYCHYSPAFTRRTVQTVKLISRVRHGLESGDFELHYQPKIRLADGQVCGCEGLIRWRDGEGGFIPPGMFMPKVENTTLISPVTRFVALEACQFAKECLGTVSINFSVRNLLDEELREALKAWVVENGIPPQRLEIEITESALMQDIEAAKQAITHIRDFGIGVSIDDFGTGFASFEYLNQLPITGLKIDRAFVSNLEQDERARKLMSCMIDVGHALDLVVTAEGVETLGQYRILQNLGCDQAQGFFFSPALSADQYWEWCCRFAARLDL